MKNVLNDIATLVLLVALVGGILLVGFIVLGHSGETCINADLAQGYTQQQAMDDCIGENR